MPGQTPSTASNESISAGAARLIAPGAGETPCTTGRVLVNSQDSTRRSGWLKNGNPVGDFTTGQAMP